MTFLASKGLFECCISPIFLKSTSGTHGASDWLSKKTLETLVRQEHNLTLIFNGEDVGKITALEIGNVSELPFSRVQIQKCTGTILQPNRKSIYNWNEKYDLTGMIPCNVKIIIF